MSQQPDSVTATFYLQLAPEWRQYARDADGNPILCRAHADRLTKNRPNPPKGGTVTVKISVQVPAAMFLPLMPTATVVVPSDLAETNVIVEALDPASGSAVTDV